MDYQYDFHARWLDAAVPGFSTPDPLSERHYNENPYAYCGLDPVNRIDPLGLDWFGYEDGRGVWYDYFPGWTQLTVNNKAFMVGNKKYNIYGGKSVSFTYDKIEYYGDAKGELFIVKDIPEITARPSNSYMLYGFAASGNSGSYYDDSEEGGESSNPFTLLDAAGGVLTLEGGYNSFFHNHTTYKTTKGITKNIYKPNGAVRSARAAKFASTSKIVKGAGVVGTAFMTGVAGYNIVNSLNNGSAVSGKDVADFSVGAVGLGTSVLVAVGLVSNPIGWVIGGGVTLYSIGSFAYDLITTDW